MKKRANFLAYGALIAAMYAALTHLQNLLIPGSATWAVQFRASEALCVLAFFTPAAIPGLSVGCFLFNLTFSGALPLDMLMGTAATLLATGGMYGTRKIRFHGIPVVGLLLPAVTNALLVGWELTLFVGGGFWLNGLYVALGELGVLFTLGLLLDALLRRKGLAQRIFR